jgi:hypothetical protein
MWMVGWIEHGDLEALEDKLTSSCRLPTSVGRHQYYTNRRRTERTAVNEEHRTVDHYAPVAAVPLRHFAYDDRADGDMTNTISKWSSKGIS